MAKQLSFLIFLCIQNVFPQSGELSRQTEIFIVPEFLIGKTMPANTNFPETNLQTALLLSFGRKHTNNEQEWAYRLGYPRSGISFAAIDFGNSEKVGQAFSVLPFLEFGLFKRSKKSYYLNIGMGATYFNTQYDPVYNPFNRAVSTDLAWSFRMFFYHTLLKSKTTNWRLGVGYFHHSNGHTRLPNQGLNSFLMSLSAHIDWRPKNTNDQKKPKPPSTNFGRSVQTYLSIEGGAGQNVLSKIFNTRKEVYAFAISLGRTINKTYKFGGGIYYRFYETYYDYIKNEGTLVKEQYPHFKKHPFVYASTLGLFGSAELLLNHFGVEIKIGLNLHKPFYKIDWQLNQGYSYQSTDENGDPTTVVVLGELDSYYELKRTISSRLGLKYYLFGTNDSPKHNFFIGVSINANLGQADFTSLSLGYVRSFALRKER